MRPLEGLTIIEMAGLGPGPVCGMLLADMGADIILVERRNPPPDAIHLTAADVARYAICHRGKRSIAVDLKQADGVAIVERLLGRADGLIEGFRPGVMERLGLGPDVCLERRPSLVYGRVTGWGRDGPLSGAAGHDLNYIALSGALYHGGDAQSAPAAPPTLVGDVGGGALFLAVGMLAALLHVRGGGAGQVVDAAITDGSALSTALLYGLFEQHRWSRTRGSNLLDGGSHWYGCYECADGRYVTVAALEPAFYRQLLERLGLADDAAFAGQYDPEAWPEQRDRLAEVFRRKTRAEWCDLLEGSDACFAPVLDFAEAPEHPHNRARGTFVEVDGVRQPAPAPRFAATPSSAGRPPQHGADTDGVLEALGYSDREIADLWRREIL